MCVDVTPSPRHLFGTNGALQNPTLSLSGWRSDACCRAALVLRPRASHYGARNESEMNMSDTSESLPFGVGRFHAGSLLAALNVSSCLPHLKPSILFSVFFFPSVPFDNSVTQLCLQDFLFVLFEEASCVVGCWSEEPLADATTCVTSPLVRC